MHNLLQQAFTVLNTFSLNFNNTSANPSLRSLQATCQPSTFYNSTIHQCQSCPPGTFSGLIQNFKCSTCPPGSFWNNDCYNCGQCTPCYVDTFSTSSVLRCTPCPVGSHATTGSTACVYTTCPAGSYVRYDNNTRGYNCAKISPGCYGSAPTTSTNSCPLSCPAQSYSLAGATSCTLCPLGTFSAEGSSKCWSCGPGEYWSETSCVVCPSNTYSIPSGLSCSTCPAGQYSVTGSTDCFLPNLSAVPSGSTDASGITDSTANSTEIQIIIIVCIMIATAICIGFLLWYFVKYVLVRPESPPPEAVVTLPKKPEQDSEFTLITDTIKHVQFWVNSESRDEYQRVPLPTANAIEDEFTSSKSFLTSQSSRTEIAESNTVFQVAEATHAVEIFDDNHPYAEFNHVYATSDATPTAAR